MKFIKRFAAPLLLYPEKEKEDEAKNAE